MGVHAWGSGTSKFTYLTGIDVAGASNRLVACYLDLNHLDLQAPSSIVVEANFFLGTSARLLGTVNGLFMTGNLGMGVEVSPAAQASTPVNCRIADNTGAPATRATASLSLTNASTFEFDFGAALVFDAIASVQYTVVSDAIAPDLLPSHVARTPVGKNVVVEFASAVSATVHMEVAQCL